MLRGLRQASSNWLGKLIMAAVVMFLVVSFAIWGIGDIFRGFGVSTVARIGRTEITVEQFRQLYNDRLQQYSRRIGRPIAPDQARAAGIDGQILSEVIADTVLDERAQQLGLAMSDQEVVRQIMQDPNFHGTNGQFDQQRFQYLIRQAGFNEQRFAIEQRRVSLRRQLAGSVANDVKPPQTIAEAVNRYQNEQRDVEYVVLDASKAGDVPAPTPEQLAAYYDKHKFRFRAPEYRKVSLLTVSPEAIARNIEVSDADAKRAYEDRQSRYVTPEKRQLQQIAFPSIEEAQAAHAKLQGGMTFEALAAERNVPSSDLDLGLVTKSDMLDPTIAAAAFALPEAGTSEPVRGRFANVIVHVTKIEPGSSKPFAEVEAQIKQDLALERAKTAVADQRDKVEDELAAGLRLDEVAQKLKLPPQTVDAIDRSGRDPNGAVVTPKDVDLAAVFATQEGVQNDPQQLPGGGYVWYEVAGITPGRERTLDEVKDRVETRWRDEQVAERLSVKGEELAGKLRSGSRFAEVTAADWLKLETAKGLKRQGSSPLPGRVVAEVFKAPKDGVVSLAGDEPTKWVVLRVTDIHPPAFDAKSPDIKKLLDGLRSAYADDLMVQYVGQLQSELGVKINPTALNQAVGRGSVD